MKEFTTGAVKDTGGKGRCDLLPMCALLRIAKHMENVIATGHYPERNWEKGLPIHCLIDSALRHLMKYVDGWTDEDHLTACASNILMAMWMEEKKPEMQDIPTRINNTRPCDDELGISRKKAQYLNDIPLHTNDIKAVYKLNCEYFDPATKVCNNTINGSETKCNGSTNECIFSALRTCSSYDAEQKRCLGTREMDTCTCGGLKSKCNFYGETE